MELVSNGIGARKTRSFNYDVFIDLTAADLDRQHVLAYVEALVRDAGLSGTAGLVTLVLLEGKELPPSAANVKIRFSGAPNPPEEFRRAIRGAANAGRHLVVVLDSLLPSSELLQSLIEQFEQDPLFGTLQPRFSDAATDQIWPLTGARDLN